jgi:hypothetical protein
MMMMMMIYGMLSFFKILIVVVPYSPHATMDGIVISRHKEYPKQ